MRPSLKGDTPFGQRFRQGALQRRQALGFRLTSFFFFPQLHRQLDLQHRGPNEKQYEDPEQTDHDIGDRRPDAPRGGDIHAFIGGRRRWDFHRSSASYLTRFTQGRDQTPQFVAAMFVRFGNHLHDLLEFLDTRPFSVVQSFRGLR